MALAAAIALGRTVVMSMARGLGLAPWRGLAWARLASSWLIKPFLTIRPRTILWRAFALSRSTSGL